MKVTESQKSSGERLYNSYGERIPKYKYKLRKAIPAHVDKLLTSTAKICCHTYTKQGPYIKTASFAHARDEAQVQNSFMPCW